MPVARYDLLPVGANGKRRHTHATLHLEAWRDAAACRGQDPNLFHPGEGAAGRLQARQARAICEVCPVRFECLAHALAAHEDRGIWGGATERQRRRMRVALRAIGNGAVA